MPTTIGIPTSLTVSTIPVQTAIKKPSVASTHKIALATFGFGCTMGKWMKMWYDNSAGTFEEAISEFINFKGNGPSAITVIAN